MNRYLKMTKCMSALLCLATAAAGTAAKAEPQYEAVPGIVDPARTNAVLHEAHSPEASTETESKDADAKVEPESKAPQTNSKPAKQNAESKVKSQKTVPGLQAAETAAFAPVSENHPLAAVWNDPEFAKEMIGSYGILPDVEPRLTPEEQLFYREKLMPLLSTDANKAIPELLSRIKPDGNALFDYTLANLYFQDGNLTNAVKYFEQATLKFPKFRRAWKNLGLAYVRDGKYEEAIVPLSKAMSLGDVDGKAYGLLAFSFLNAGKFVSAEAAYRQAILFEPESVDFRLGLVKSQVNNGNYDGALAVLDELLQLQPDRDTFWSIQANVYLQKDQPAKAAVNFEVLRRMGKASVENLATLGDIYMMEEARDLALGAYLEAVEKDGWQKPGRALRAADILVSRGAYDQARSLFGKIRETAGANLATADELKLLKLESKVEMNSGAGDKAIRVLEQIIERDPLDGEALLLAGDYYARNGQQEKAEFRYDTAAKLDGFSADAYVKQAQLLVKTSKYAQATELLKKAQKVKPRDNVQSYLDKVEELARGGRS